MIEAHKKHRADYPMDSRSDDVCSEDLEKEAMLSSLLYDEMHEEEDRSALMRDATSMHKQDERNAND